MTGRRIVSIFLPRLAIESWLHRRARQGAAWTDTVPLALAAPGPHGPVIHAATRTGEEVGARPGARVVDCRSICPELRVEDAQPAQDAARLARLAFWIRRWGPFSAVDDADGLVLDITGTAHLFGGEPALLTDIQAGFARAGLTCRLGLAPTRGAAWALARFGPERAICTDPLPALAPLPVAALRLSPQTLLLLHRLGLKTIGDLAAIPRLPLMRRFSRTAPADNPLIRLDQALGRAAEPLDAPEPPAEFAAEARLAEPVMDPSDWLPGLTGQLCAGMAAQDRGCRRLCLSVFRVDGERRDIRVALAAPARDPAHLLRLFQGRLDRLDPGYGFDLIRLAAEAVEPLAQAQPALDGSAPEALALSRLVDRLVARFGAAAISRPLPQDSHIPERSEIPGPPLDDSPAPPARPDRPLRLLTPPEEIQVLYAIPEGPPAQFIWRRQTLRVARHAGPERIAPEWWQDRPGTRLRDYFRIEDDSGRRLWIYREGLAQDGRGGAPRWFLHGIFA
ncbi:Y-family DNA polymerase [Paracoccus sp. DMF]|uniref:Y-family DNA polymerase n=1 Tax=Paracoccus sp. DMF TaxID=400837 RepID=UPI0021E38A55|nr:DNA polymerase Y family protein [Paracoccus sp. DMF]MCV2446558.1 DNA polymerase Y family protein [Paracoccus sp. DMF]